MAGIRIFTDGRYLRQRMPMALQASLLEHGREQVEVTCVDELCVEVGRDLAGFQVEPDDLVVPRTRSAFALALLQQVEGRGIACCNTWAAIDCVRDKVRAASALSAANIPTPRTFLADRPASLSRLPASCWPLVLKPPLGDNATGIQLVSGPDDLDRLVWNDDLVLAQQYVDVAGVDVKLYGVGQYVWAVRRPSPLNPGAAWCEPLPVSPLFRDLALACAHAFSLDLYGVDVLFSQHGPLVVDVNDFPNYTGIDEAPAMLATFLEARSSVAVPA